MPKQKRLIDERRLTKMQIRKLNALRKSVGSKIGEEAFLKWFETQEQPVDGIDHNIEVIAKAVSRIRSQLRFQRGCAYILRQGKGRVIVEAAAIRNPAAKRRKAKAVRPKHPPNSARQTYRWRVSYMFKRGDLFGCTVVNCGRLN